MAQPPKPAPRSPATHCDEIIRLIDEVLGDRPGAVAERDGRLSPARP